MNSKLEELYKTINTEVKKLRGCMNIRKFLSALVIVISVFVVIAYSVGATNLGDMLLVSQTTCFIALLVVDAIEDL